ncbi:MAG TPA: 50S ribosomal protein L11 methyltransferase, partial [Thermodesulfobacteriota bacterium]|nr:50S ribosomal protein L11 methyltransferase [Thermodesulfobacteriota bacterium]
MPKSWVEITIEIPSRHSEAVSNFLIELGSPGVIQGQGRGRMRERITGYFADSLPARTFEKKTRDFLSATVGRDYSVSRRVIREEKWAEAWKKNFKPAHVTPRLVVKPPWEEYGARKNEVVIEIDPGMAFGTGTHATTRLCLKALEDSLSARLKPAAILDVGTGSGILAIAAVKLGVRHVLGIDIDAVAVDCARENSRANGVDHAIDFRVGTPGRLRKKFDIVLANLLPQELLRSVASISARVKPGGTLIASGFLKKQRQEIVAAFKEHELKEEESRQMRG